eukprot:CAMPEP_0170858502 /NCGR_PEP_ID=MMETSP0734-20130129/16050_1 /TAXON_ID=186038 /ORGANISM="Fragilariopsis kerguelensis, Strain L26-C5" /LENGTH=239 /DNA_ID=CAMNT_0011231191 /DNA_START=221 /DNA_END=937 /DNA_ORIENTATION=-
MTIPSLPPSLIGETKATESSIDAYATRILETMSPLEGSSIDDSLGPYVTSLLRCADIQDKYQVTNLLEFESLLELLEDQSNMDKKTASDCIIMIADVVVTGVLPFSERAIVPSRGPSGLYTGGGLDSFLSMKTHLPETAPGNIDNSVGGSSPLKPDNLIPIDLMGALDDPSPNHSDQMCNNLSPTNQVYQFQIPPGKTLQQQHILNQQLYPQLQDTHDVNQPSQTDEDFPPLGTPPEKT